MEQKLEEIREQQKASWNKFSPGWKKYDELTMDFLKPMGDEMIQQLHLKETDVVLDIASGTGEPGLSMASILKSGNVILTDLAEDMLAIAKENGTRRGIKNIETRVCDVSELPFADNSFNAVSCRLGFMFFPDMLMAAKEMVRVLKPGGRMATAVWNVPEKNFWVTAVMGTLGKHIEMPKPPPGAPGLFRCAQDGLMTDLFRQAGLKNISQKEITSKLKPQKFDVYWGFMTETPAPVAAALSKVDNTMKEKIKKEVHELLNQKYPDGKISIDTSAFVICGEK